MDPLKAAIDTSVLVSALHRDHPHHEDARAWLEATLRKDVVALVTTHALAETWSVLSRIPGPNRLSPARVRDMVRRIEDIVTVVPLDVGADLLLTFNLNDFVRLQSHATPHIVSPSEVAPTP